MRKLMLMLLVFASVLFLALTTGCKTCPGPISYVLPADLSPPALENSSDPIAVERDYVRLVAQDLRWRLRMAAARLIVGEITSMEYTTISDDIHDRLRGVYE